MRAIYVTLRSVTHTNCIIGRLWDETTSTEPHFMSRTGRRI